MIVSTAPYRAPPPQRGQKLITHDGFKPPPPPETDGFEALQVEIRLTEQRLLLMRERLELLWAREKRKRKTMASVAKVKPMPPVKAERA